MHSHLQFGSLLVSQQVTVPTSQCPGTAPTSASPLITLDGARSEAHGNARGGSPPKVAWQVTRGHAALSAAELQQLARRNGQQQGPLTGAPRSLGAELHGGRFEHRHAAQQQVIAEQQRRLREQQELIAQLQDTHNMAELRKRSADVQTCANAQTPAGPRQPITQLNGLKEPHTGKRDPDKVR